jgi:hypothetical protein
MELILQIVKVLRGRGEKRIKSVFWNRDSGSLSVFLKGYPGKNLSFNYVPPVELSVEEIVDILIASAEVTLADNEHEGQDDIHTP